MAKGALLFNLMARRYAAQPIADQAAYEKKLEITRKYLRPEDEVFEFGCGTGSTALLHAPYVRHIHAIDYASNMITIANEKKAEAGIDNASFAVGDINELNPAESQYDVVLGLNILQLIEDIDPVIDKVHALLKPGGYFISSSVCMSRPPGVWRLLLPLLSFLHIAPAVKGRSKEDLLGSLQRAGFSIAERYDPETQDAVVFLVAKKAQ